MRADIDFSKLSGTQLSKGKRTLIFTLYFLLIVILATLSAVYAYFTSTAAANGNLYFGEISVGFYDEETVLTSNTFKTKFTNLTPGDTLDLSNINIKNTGTHSAYVLVNVDIEITNEGARTLHYNQWYSIQGEEVNINDMTANIAKATRLAKDSSESTYIKWKVPSEVLSNEYQGATASVTLSAYASQVNLEEGQYYVDADLYASYFICKNASYTAESMDTPTTYNGSKVSGEPLMRIDDVEDTIDYTTKQVTRNIAKIELTGNETWNTSYAPTIYFNLKDAGYGAGQSSDIANVVCSHAPSTNSGESFYARITNGGGTCIGFAKCFEGFGVSNLEEFTAYLAEQYEKGTPVTLWYVLSDAAKTTSAIFTNKNLWSSNSIVEATGNGLQQTLVTSNDVKIPSLTNTQFTISFNIQSNNVKYSETGNLLSFRIVYSDNTESYIGVTTNNYEDRYLWFTTIAGKTVKSIDSIIANNIFTSGTIKISNIQLEIGTSPTDYEEYN